MRYGKIRVEDGNLIFFRHMIQNNLPCRDIVWAYIHQGRRKRRRSSEADDL